MKRTLKKSVSILLSLIMVFSLFTIVPITAYAEETEQPVLYAIATEDVYDDPNRMIGALYYDSDGQTSAMNVSPIKLTFYYGVKPTDIPDGNSVWTQPTRKIGTCIFDVPVTNTSTSSYPDWYVGSNAPNTLRRHAAVTSVVFDQSCMNASPGSTVNWFKDMTRLKAADLRYLNTGKISNMKNMFYGCSALEAVVALGWDIGKLKYTDKMFYLCKNLEYIYCEDDWSQSSTLSSDTNMFYKCEKLPNFNLVRVDKTKAKSGGYFSNDPLSRLTKDSEGCYEIGSEDDLIFLGDHVGRYQIFSCEGLTFKLTRDLDFTDMPIEYRFYTFVGNFHPIGLPYDDNFNGYFGGHFDGQNHSITGLIFENGLNSVYSENKGAGLFNILKGTRSGFDAVVENLTLIEPQFNSIYHSGGGIVGERATRAVIRNCSVLGGSISHNKDGAGIAPQVSKGSIEGCAVIGTSFVSTNGVANSLIACFGTDLSVKDCVYYNPNELPVVSEANYTDGGGNTQVYRLTADDGISVSGERVAYDGKYYFAQNDAVVLTTAEREGYTCIGYMIDDVFTAGNTVNMPNRDVTVSAKQVSSYDFTQSGDTYTIYTADGWDVFCDMLADSDKGVFTGKTVKLADDITVTRMAGSSYHDFTGTFNGQGHTLTFNSTDAVDYCAPFRYTEGTPVFRDLIIDGTINTSGAYAAGLIGHLYGNVSIERCTSRVEITSNGNSGGFVGLCEQEVAFKDCVSSTVIHCNAGNNSGFVGWSRSSKYTISFEGCVFNGKLLKNDGTGNNGGFIGWKGDAKTVTVTNCLYAPAALDEGEAFADSNSATFSREHSNYTATITNCYYTAALGAAQGKQAYTITAGDDVTLGLSGEATEYGVSGITAYENNNGLLYGDTFYAGNGDSVSLTLGNTTPTGYAFTGYTVTAGTLEGTENPYTLTMPDSDVTVNAAFDLIGDANRDGEVNVNDVTAIQRHLTDVEVIPERFLVLADTDGNGEVNISDATRLQMYIAHYDISLG